MAKDFDFFTKYISDNEDILHSYSRRFICKDQYISILKLPEHLNSTLMSKGINKISKLIMIGNSFLQFWKEVQYKLCSILLQMQWAEILT